MKLFLLTLLVFLCFSQNNYSVETLTMEDGLSSNSINTIFQDKQGYMWFGTNGGGLNSYDGYTIRKYRHNPFDSTTISSDYIYSIVQDSNFLWIGTINGLNKFDLRTRTFKRFLYDPKNKFSILNNRINSIAKINNNLWVGSPSGLNRINLRNDSIYFIPLKTPLRNQHTPYVRTISVLNDSVLFLGMNSGLLQYNYKSKKTALFQKEGTPYQYIRASHLFDDKLWVAYHKGLSVFDIKKNKFINTHKLNFLQVKSVLSIQHSMNGELCISTNKGLFYLTTNDYLHREILVKEKTLLSKPTYTYSNSPNIFWVSTIGNGVLKVEIKKDKFRKIPLHVKQIFSLNTGTKNTIWTGTNEGLLKNGQLEVPRIFPVYKVLSVTDNYVWFWARLSIYKYHIKDKRIEQFDILAGEHRVIPYNLIELDNKIIVLSYQGSFVFNENKNKFTKYTELPEVIKNIKIKTIIKKGEDYWIASNSGLYLYETKSEKLISINYEQKTINLYSVYSFDKENIWLTSPFGLFNYNLNKNTYQRFTEEDGLTDNNARAIIEAENGSLWLSTTNGITNLLFSGNKLIKTNKYFLPKGSNYQAFINEKSKSANGLFYFATKTDLIAFDPKKMEKLGNHEKPSVFHLRAGKKRFFINENVKIELEPFENTIWLEFSSFDFVETKKSQYAFKVDGLDNNWVLNGRINTVRLTNLSPGSYTFHLKSANKSGVWSEHIYSLPFIVKPAFWQTWWFYSFILIFLSAVAFYFYYLRLQTRKSIERLRLKIATDLHDDVGANLTKIALYSESMHVLSERNIIPSSDKLNRVKELSRRSIDSMSDIVWAIDTRNNTIKDLLNKLEDFFHDVNSKLNIAIEFKHGSLNTEKSIAMDSRKNIFLIIKEFVTNAIKYSNATTIYVTIENKPVFLLSIWDDGNSEPTVKKTGNGLRNIVLRAKEIGYELNVDTENGYKLTLKGTSL